MRTTILARCLVAILTLVTAIPSGFCETKGHRMTYTIPNSTSRSAIKIHLDRPTEGNPLRELKIENESGQTELVWQSTARWDWSVLPIKVRSKGSRSDEYSNATILGATLSKTRLTVVFEFRLNKNDQQTKGAFQDWFDSNGEIETWDGRIQFLRTFVRNEKGKWDVELSAFPQTFWKSVRGESLAGIEMRDGGGVSFSYAGGWKVVSDQRTGYRKEIGAKADKTVFDMVFDEGKALLLTGDSSGKSSYVTDSVWWLGKDEWFVGPFNQIPERKIFLRQQEKKAKESGIDLTNNSRF